MHRVGDMRDHAAACEIRSDGRGRGVADNDRGCLVEAGSGPEAEAVVAGEGVRELVVGAEDVDRSGLPVVLSEDHGVGAGGGWNRVPDAVDRADELGPTDGFAQVGVERDRRAAGQVAFGQDGEGDESADAG